MTIKMVSGNQAVAYAALRAGARVICGYPGTPSTDAVDSLLQMGDIPGTHVEWSTNEKVAIEVAATASWAGKRTLCTMKMSGVNVAMDSLIGISHSGAVGGFVVYVADDPGVSSGMCEQDTRGYALMCDMAMLEASSVQDLYSLTKYAFELSEATKAPVFVRSVTCLAQSIAPVDIEDPILPNQETAILFRDINRYAKAGALMCMTQHSDAIQRLAAAAELIRSAGLHRLELSKKGDGLGIISVGVCNSYLAEALQLASAQGFNEENISFLRAACTVPYPVEEIQAMLRHCAKIVVIEELEPFMEREVYVQAHTIGSSTQIIGKLDGTLSRIGAYNAAIAAKALCKATGIAFDESIFSYGVEAAAKSLPRPITPCAGCPHRGTYMAINKAIKNAKLVKENVVVTGDIGCTILGINPPFDTVWMEISMGASIPNAHGYAMADVKRPIFATIGDSTFFHGGMPGLINAIQHDTDMIVIIMDNGWTAMTGMQVNPNTGQDFQYENLNRIDLLPVVQGMGVKNLFVTDPFKQKEFVETLDQCILLPGLKVVIARRECAIQTNRRKIKYATMSVDNNRCIRCKMCISTTGCPALSFVENQIIHDSVTCNGCGLCANVCPKQAIIRKEN